MTWRQEGSGIFTDDGDYVGHTDAAADAALVVAAVNGMSAWREAEALLPEGCTLELRHLKGGGYYAEVLRELPFGREAKFFCYHYTDPELALRNLIGVLRKYAEAKA